MTKMDRLVGAYNASVEQEKQLASNMGLGPLIRTELVAIEMGVQRGLAIAVSIEMGVEYDTAMQSLREGLL